MIERKGRKGETSILAIGFYDRTTWGLIARNNGLLWPTRRTQKISFSSPKRFPSPFQIPHSFQVPYCASQPVYNALQCVNGRSWSNYPTTWLNHIKTESFWKRPSRYSFISKRYNHIVNITGNSWIRRVPSSYDNKIEKIDVSDNARDVFSLRLHDGIFL